MRNLLLISHRFPCPPDRKEKLRLWNLIRPLARTHRVFLGSLADNAGDDDASANDAAYPTAYIGIRCSAAGLIAGARQREGRALHGAKIAFLALNDKPTSRHITKKPEFWPMRGVVLLSPLLSLAPFGLHDTRTMAGRRH